MYCAKARTTVIPATPPGMGGGELGKSQRAAASRPSTIDSPSRLPNWRTKRICSQKDINSWAIYSVSSNCSPSCASFSVVRLERW
jgi:hypothetical protein